MRALKILYQVAEVPDRRRALNALLGAYYADDVCAYRDKDSPAFKDSVKMRNTRGESCGQGTKVTQLQTKVLSVIREAHKDKEDAEITVDTGLIGEIKKVLSGAAPSDKNVK